MKTAKSPPKPPGQTASLAAVLHQIEAILTTDDPTFKGLTKAAGLDPKNDFKRISLNNVPLTDQDIRGFDFSGSDLRNTDIEHARHDRTTTFDAAIFDGPSLDRVQ